MLEAKLTWKHIPEKKEYEGRTACGTRLYVVSDDECGWFWDAYNAIEGENLFVDGGGYHETAQEAMDDANADWENYCANHDEDEPVYTLEELLAMYGDDLYEARRDDPDCF